MEPHNHFTIAPPPPATPTAGPAHPAPHEGDEREFWRVRRVARILDISPKRVYQLVQENKLTAIRISPRNMRILRQSVEDYLAGCLAAAQAEPDE